MTLYESVNIPLWRMLKPLTGLRILDIGCGTGALGELLEKNGNKVEGITYSEGEAAIARDRISKVTVLDLNAFRGRDDRVRGPFDVILYADVLEHLLDPVGTVKTFLPLLKPDGTIYVSLPNIACFYIRAGLLFGRFNTGDSGILDRTHLHHYTLKTAKEMLGEAGLAVEKVDFVPAPSVWAYQTFLKKKAAPDAPPPKMAEGGAFQLYERRIYPIERFFTGVWRSMFANQFVFACKAAGK